MNRLDEQSLAQSCAICCEVAAEALVRVSLESLPELRRNPGPSHGEPLPPCFLKHADEQTVAGLSAVFQAISRSGLQGSNFRDWGVLAAPRFLGRPTMAAALQRFAAEGAWGVSPHLIPHRSLHSISGTVSQALKIHGPNFGVGGGPGGTVEVLLAATALLERKHLPGVWVVLTCLDPELPLEESGRLAPHIQAVGLALALTPLSNHGSGLRLQIIRGKPDAETLACAGHLPEARSGFDLLRLATLLEQLNTPGEGSRTLIQLLDAHSRLELSRVGPTSALRSGRRMVRLAEVPADTDCDPGHLALADH